MNQDTAHPRLAGRVATATTRLILIAIVAGGLVTVAMNLWQMRSTGNALPSTTSDTVAPLNDLLRDTLPVVQDRVRGSEAAARDAVVNKIRDQIAAAVSEVASRTGAVETKDDPFRDAIELARDPGGVWSVHQLQEVGRRIVGVARSGREPAVLFWGGYDEAGPGEWTTWIMQLPLPKE
ncbi:hypothetical protein Pan44_54630 [Caulifigura coniformis]|uniref:Uncharacterized protein n=1 Tax=Caulifigura coniformis TaxID=2527983 RepID=A0A517SMN6_9PLAN|nr:hypothetical protein [Caulifigura coniformis]QDT57394.1 hypothetical protein Pan44_54630 [Caulifigura coniformis]